MTLSTVLVQGMYCLVVGLQNQGLPVYTGYGLKLPVVSEPLFYCGLVLQICLSGLFLVPVTILVYVQTGNFINGKTTMERFSRAAYNTEDQTYRAMNSGITDDRRIIIETNLNMGSLSDNIRSDYELRQDLLEPTDSTARQSFSAGEQRRIREEYAEMNPCTRGCSNFGSHCCLTEMRP